MLALCLEPVVVLRSLLDPECCYKAVIARFQILIWANRAESGWWGMDRAGERDDGPGALRNLQTGFCRAPGTRQGSDDTA